MLTMCEDANEIQSEIVHMIKSEVQEMGMGGRESEKHNASDPSKVT